MANETSRGDFQIVPTHIMDMLVEAYEFADSVNALDTPVLRELDAWMTAPVVYTDADPAQFPYLPQRMPRGGRMTPTRLVTASQVAHLAEELNRIRVEVQVLAERVGLPDPGAADTTELYVELWNVVDTFEDPNVDTSAPHVDETRAGGWSS